MFLMNNYLFASADTFWTRRVSELVWGLKILLYYNMDCPKDVIHLSPFQKKAALYTKYRKLFWFALIKLMIEIWLLNYISLTPTQNNFFCGWYLNLYPLLTPYLCPKYVLSSYALKSCLYIYT